VLSASRLLLLEVLRASDSEVRAPMTTKQAWVISALCLITDLVVGLFWFVLQGDHVIIHTHAILFVWWIWYTLRAWPSAWPR
jgi:hypothetical protein